VQADGYVLNPGLWNSDWLEYDYIGAPWYPVMRLGQYEFKLRNRVGNGGFSLRSCHLLQLTATIDWSAVRFPTTAEDVLTCHVLHDLLFSKGFRFPTPEVAATFSIEDPGAAFGHDLDTTFGFHGKYYLPQALARGEFEEPA